jgi:hypothetical protein
VSTSDLSGGPADVPGGDDARSFDGPVNVDAQDAGPSALGPALVGSRNTATTGQAVAVLLPGGIVP